MGEESKLARFILDVIESNLFVVLHDVDHLVGVAFAGDKHDGVHPSVLQMVEYIRAERVEAVIVVANPEECREGGDAEVVGLGFFRGL